jgi:catechol 2,3-dioxygenase-like lactoylglutathione lyase family enzyme
MLSPMIDHIGLEVQDLPRAKAFYLAALAPLGYALVKEFTPEAGIGFVGCGLGAGGKPDLWLEGNDRRSGPVHVALHAKDTASVDAFHRAALAAGGRDNGAPGPRPHYHPGYYGAFVIDPEGNNLEAVCHKAR